MSMNNFSDPQYNACRSCNALNMSHRQACCQCGQSLEDAVRLGERTYVDHYRAIRDEIRRSGRQPVSLGATILERNGSPGPNSSIDDICENGLSFSSPRSFVEGGTVLLHVPLFGQTHIVKGT